MTGDNLQNEDDAIPVQSNEIKTGENDLNNDASTYSELSGEIGSGGNIELRHKYYTYDNGSTISISPPNSVINGKGAVIDMAGSTIQAFKVSASGVTIKNLTIKNVNYTGMAAGIYFDASAFSGTVENCNFVNVRSDNIAGAICFISAGNVINCNFTNNTVSYGGGAVYFDSSGIVENCNFTNNAASNNGGAIRFNGNDNVTNCNFTNNSAENGGDRLDSYDGNYGFYRRCGFMPLSYCEFVEKFAPKDWNGSHENIIFFGYANKQTKYETENDFYNDKKNKVSVDYDTAEEKRDNILDKKNWSDDYD